MNTALAEKIDEPKHHVVRAFHLPDLSDKANWLVERLKPRFPGHQESHIISWLRSITGTNGVSNYRFVRTDRGVALSEYRHEKLVVQCTIIDHFVFLEEGADVSEGEALYDDMKRWAVSLGAAEIIIDPKSDIGKNWIEGRLGKLVERKVLVAKVGK
jgi:hypothetical protein